MQKLLAGLALGGLIVVTCPTGATAANDPRGAGKMLRAGDYVGATLAVDDALEMTSPTNLTDTAMRKLRGDKKYASGLVEQVRGLQNGTHWDYSAAAKALSLARGRALVDATTADSVLADVKARYWAGVEAGRIRGLASDTPLLFEGAPYSVEKAITLATLKDDSPTDPTASATENALAFAKSRPSWPTLKNDLMAALAGMNPTIGALRGPIMSEFPAYAQSQLASRVVPTFVDVDGDQLFALDLKDALRKIETVELVDSPSAARATVKVKQLGLTIAQVPTETTTVRYAQYEVNLLAAALLMPDNATYQFEYSKGGVEYEYAFDVNIAGQGAAHLVLRDRGSSSWAKCSSARIVNVFGGSQPANFTANNQMAAMCGGGANSPTSASDVRRSIAERIARDLVKAPKRAVGDEV